MQSDTRCAASGGGLTCIKWWLALFLLVQPLWFAASAAADPAPRVVMKLLAEPKWISHRVIPGEFLRDIGDLYAVSADSIIRWNDLDEKRPRLRAGQKLRIKSKLMPPPRKRRIYTVRRGDSWHRIAKKFGVDLKRLRGYWNRKAPRHLRAGQRLVVWAWVEPPPEARPKPEVKGKERRPLPVKELPGSGFSVGTPGRGRLINGVQLPENKELYKRRKPENSWGSSHAVENLQKAIALFRQDTGFDRELVICDMSRKGGGRFSPHGSHRSGRDVDIRLPLRKGLPTGTIPKLISQVDWDATWALIRALIATGEVQYIFLSRNRQRELHRAAERAGADPQLLSKVIQFPGRTRTTIVRHSRGHIKHIHVRFKCGPSETDCRD